MRYPFGHGLSYTTFEYGEVNIQAKDKKALSSKFPTGKLVPGGQSDLWDEVIEVKSTIKNTGGRTGSEVAQLYLAFPDSAKQPERILRGFNKVMVTPGRTAELSFKLRRRDLSYWDTEAQKWAIASGEYNFIVGSSSRDLHGSLSLTI